MTKRTLSRRDADETNHMLSEGWRAQLESWILSGMMSSRLSGMFHNMTNGKSYASKRLMAECDRRTEHDP
ncbi:hypothetical protein FHS96_000531 [Sphingomonas zeicaulis]